LDDDKHLLATFHLILLALALPLLAACQDFKRSAQPQGAPSSRAADLAPAAVRPVHRSGSWRPADAEPCTLITRVEAEAAMGRLKSGPEPGGTALDGTSCAYVGANPLVVSIGVISTNSFEVHKFDPGNRMIGGLGDEAYTALPNEFGDVRLFVRQAGAALMVNVTVGPSEEARSASRQIAVSLAQKALGRLLVSAKL
jgi:hypothetical protein